MGERDGDGLKAEETITIQDNDGYRIAPDKTRVREGLRGWQSYPDYDDAFEVVLTDRLSAAASRVGSWCT